MSYGGEVDFSNDVNVLGALVEGEKTASFIGKIRTDACNLGKFIPNGVSLKIRLNQSSDAFRITSKGAGTYKMTIKECILKVCQVKVSPEELLRQDTDFEKGPAVYDYIRSDVRALQIPSGSYNASFENLYNGKVPLELIVGLLSSSAYAGKTEKNSLRFQNFNLNKVEVTVEGVSVPGPAIQPDFKNSDYAEAFNTLFKEGDHCDEFSLSHTPLSISL